MEWGKLSNDTALREVLQFGRWNVRGKYTINSIDVRRDLGVQVHNSLKVATQIDRVVKKAYAMRGFIGPEIEWAFGVLCALHEGLQSVEEVYQNDAWIRGY